MILAGDIGGTKTLLGLYHQQDSRWQCVEKKQFVSGDFETFEALLDTFLTDEKISSVCIGVAGPVVNGECHTTNLPWVLKTTELVKQTATDAVVLLNDLEATAWGVLNLPEKDFVELNPQGKTVAGNIAVIAAGTGLGEAIVAWNDDKQHILATEGGHSDFAPNTEKEILLLQYLSTLYPEHVSYERVVSGEGLINIYQFLKTLPDAVINKETEQQMLIEDAAAVISQQCINKKDVLCEEALAMFCRIYGAEAGNLALKCLPYGGVILAGGIAAKILVIMQQGLFMQGFLAKGRYRDILAKMSVRVCTNPEAGLLGAVYYAQQLKPNQ